MNLILVNFLDVGFDNNNYSNLICRFSLKYNKTLHFVEC